MVKSFFFFFNDTATTEIYTLSLHDALPIYAHPRPPGARADRPVHARRARRGGRARRGAHLARRLRRGRELGDRKSTRLNSSHSQISYAVFCLKKKKERNRIIETSTD